MEIADQINADRTLLQQLKHDDHASFQRLYTLYFPTIQGYICKNSGYHEDAEDVFQETIVVMLEKTKQPDFELTSSLRTYLFAIARNIWLKRLRENKRRKTIDLPLNILEKELILDDEHPVDGAAEKVEKWLEKITKNCQYILRAIFFYQEPMEDLMKKMGWKNKHSAANQKYKCLEQVKKEELNDRKQC
jgi:RNA polymerase sigma factor (sigma-70 family)